MKMTKSEASAITGGLSRPSKMPGKAFSVPARACNVGSKLRKVPGSVCSGCYALKGRYVFPNVQNALERRLKIILGVCEAGRGSEEWEVWLEAMRVLIGNDRFFRFHDSGDLQSDAHLQLYCDLARDMPGTRFWLPTRERRLIRDYPHGGIPANLTVRLSGAMIDQRANPIGSVLNTSEVWTREKLGAMEELALGELDDGAHNPAAYEGKHICPAPRQGNACGDCRACWDGSVGTVVYIKH